MNENKEDPVPQQTLRALSAAHLLSSVIKAYLDENVCEFIDPEQSYWDHQSFSLSLLDRIMVVGGAPRDLLLNNPINDIDMIFNLRELCKLQLNHLRKYHSKPEQRQKTVHCAYWTQYLNKFNDDSKESDSSDDDSTYDTHIKELLSMHNSTYIFNAKFIINILMNSKYFISETSEDTNVSKLSIKDLPHWGCTSIQIINRLIYGSQNLDGCQIDFIDTFNSEKCLTDDSSTTENREKIKLFHRQSRELSAKEINCILYPWMSTANNNTAQPLLSLSPSFAKTPASESDDLLLLQKSETFPNTTRNSNLRNIPPLNIKVTKNVFNRDRRNPLRQSMEIFCPNFEFGYDFNSGNISLSSSILKENEIPSKHSSVSSNVYLYSEIDIDIYSLRTEDKLSMYDFSINCAIIPLSSIWQIQCSNIQHWKSIIQNGLDKNVCNSVEDITVNHVLRVPKLHFEKHTIYSHEDIYHFWRVIRFHIKLPYFTVHKLLIDAHMLEYDQWLNVRWFGVRKNCRLFFKRWKRTLEIDCKTIHDLQNSLEILAVLKFHEQFRSCIINVSEFAQKFEDMINGVRNGNIANVQNKLRSLFVQYGYIFDANESERVKKENDVLVERVLDLEAENARLSKELEIMEKCKIATVLNANQSINQMRDFISQYQRSLRY